MAELLLELLSEEIPARMQARAAEDLKRLVTDKLKDAGLAFTRADSFVTPRRLTLVVDGLPEKQPDQTEERKGPRVGAPEPAVAGFLKAAGLSSLDQCEKRTVGKAEFWFAVAQRKGQETAAVLAGLLTDAASALPWPKSMRWGTYRRAWVRPLQRIVCLLDGKQVAGAFDLGGTAVPFGDTTVGHRFLSEGPFAVTGAADYQAKLRQYLVVLDPAERRAIIKCETERLAAAEGLRVRDDPGLLDEVTGLVEWPVALIGSIDAAFMAVPPEVLITSMRAHQRYFALETSDGKLAPRFVVIANTPGDDGGKAIVAGNERVLRARLSDAKFFWDQDQKTKLADRVPALKSRIFHAKLGSVADKVERMQALASEIAAFIPGADQDRVRRAALLAKADLPSGMVGEFPELQGVMGRYYALAEGESADVADAIKEHYAPLGPNDRCPKAPISIAVALADKLDTLVGFYAIDEKPTGSKDPFALRRAALGVIRIILESNLRVPLLAVAGRALEIQTKFHGVARYQGKAERELLAFFADRLKVALREQGVRHDLIDAVFALGGEDDLVRLVARVRALEAFLKSEDGTNLLTAYRRASNIVAIEEKKDGATYDAAVDEAALVEPEEITLARALAAARPETDAALQREDFAAAMRALAGTRGAIDTFFDRVTVNAPEAKLRANRLRLLSEIRRTLGRVADFSKIEG
jgi:glycyl-tRNA synthetase beta chain